MRKNHLLAGLLCLGCLAASVGSGASACTIDGVPSISANGQIAVRNLAVPKRATFLTWSPFLFKKPFEPGTAVRLHEDPAKLARVLAADELRSRWRWTFGDGQRALDTMTAVHRYAHAGQYRVIVSTYSAAFKQWFPFDSVQLTVR